MFGFHKKLLHKKCEVPIPHNLKDAHSVGKTRLFLSDTPEVLNKDTFPENNGTLWHDYVCTDEGKTTHRVFAWHVNNTGKNLKLGVTLENLSAQARLIIKGIKVVKHMVSEESDFLVSVGQYLAYAYLDQKFSKASKDEECLGQQITLLYENTIRNGFLLGLIMEFTVEASTKKEETQYLLRVVAGEKDIDLRTLVMQPVKKEKVHYRGSWIQGDIRGETPIYNIGEKKSYSISNGITDNIQRSLNSFDPLHATDNPGHYGVVYYLTIPICNPFNVTKTLEIGINPRGGSYAGAVKVSEKVYAIPFLNTTDHSYAKIMNFCVTPGESCVEFCVMHAGAASLPVAINIRTL